MFWCRQKLSWKADNWKSVEFIDETRICVVIGQNRKVKATFGHEVWNLECLERQQQSKYITMFGVVFATKEWVLLYQLAEILTAVTM